MLGNDLFVHRFNIFLVIFAPALRWFSYIVNPSILQRLVERQQTYYVGIFKLLNNLFR
jgi:hypothetical protein